MTVSAITQDQASSLEFRLDADAFDIPLETDRIAVQLVLDLEHLADLPQEFVVGEPVAHLVGGRTMSIRTENRTQAPQVRSKLLDRDTLLATQLPYGLPMRCRVTAPFPPPPQ